MSRKASAGSSATRTSAASKVSKPQLHGGYHFKILWVDLTSGESRVVPFGEEFALKYVGGRGFGAKILYDTLPHIKDPLGPENILVIAPGPLTGLYLPGAAKTHLVSLAPLTGIYGESSMGGNFGPELRRAGYDALVLAGRAETLSYLWIDDGNIQVVPALELAGKSALDTERMVKEALRSEEIRVAAIGPAGENLVRFATINCDRRRNSGRCGMGAVMGSKNLKAIALRGSGSLPVADPAALRLLTDTDLENLASHPMFGTRRQGFVSVADDLDTACSRCPLSCGNACLAKKGRGKGANTEGPRHERVPTRVSDFAAILKGNRLCDDLGLDTISAGVLIGTMIEAVETGLLSPGDVDGMKLEWGNSVQITQLLEKIAARDGVGDILAGGAKVVLEKWPQLTPILVHTKGMERSAYDPRATISMALACGTSDIGPHHTRAWTVGKELDAGAKWTDEDRVDIVIYHQTIRPLFDMLGVCRLPWIELGFDARRYAEYYSAVTGMPHTLDELLERSRALYDLTRLISTSRGISRKDDYPAPQMFDLPIKGGQYEGRVVDRSQYEELLSLYYRKRGWTKDGIPPAATAKAFSEGLA